MSRVVRRSVDGVALTGFAHRGCGGQIVYNGNYYCEHWQACGGTMSAPLDHRWPPELLTQESCFAAALAANYAGRFRYLGEVDIL